MKFTVNTKPLKNALNMAVIKSNVSRLFYSSTLLQIRVNLSQLILNIEATELRTQVTLNGSGEGDGEDGIIVDVLTFKGIIDSINSDVVTLQINTGNLGIIAKPSKFTLPQEMDIHDAQLKEPVTDYSNENEFTLDVAGWNFVKDHQAFALPKLDSLGKTACPVYHNIWVGNNNDVVTGDMTNEIFTHSNRGNFDKTCLLPISLLNLFTSVPEGSKLSRVGDNSYVLKVTTDAYTIHTEFSPRLEEDPRVGSYSADFILDKISHPDQSFKLEVAPVLNFLKQIKLLWKNVVPMTLMFCVRPGSLTITEQANEYTIPIDCNDEYTVKFDAELLKSILSNFDSDFIQIAKMETDDKVTGCSFWSNNMTVLLASKG